MEPCGDPSHRAAAAAAAADRPVNQRTEEQSVSQSGLQFSHNVDVIDSSQIDEHTKPLKRHTGCVPSQSKQASLGGGGGRIRKENMFTCSACLPAAASAGNCEPSAGDAAAASFLPLPTKAALRSQSFSEQDGKAQRAGQMLKPLPARSLDGWLGCLLQCRGIDLFLHSFIYPSIYLHTTLTDRHHNHDNHGKRRAR